jgi:glycosyltransferase involved in cell wall biosynthesis
VTFVHILTSSYWPHRGGMEESVGRIAALLTRPGDRTCIIYVRDTKPAPEGAEAPDGGKVVYLWQEKAGLAPPALASVTGYPSERHRMDYLLFRNRVSDTMTAHPAHRHVLLSVYLSDSGFLAQHVASELAIPHIARASGSDLSADLHNPYKMHAVELVVRRATHVVTVSREQEGWLRATGLRANRITTIHNSLPDDFPAERWQFRSDADIHLVSDGGYQFNKGTHLLFAAYRHAVRRGVSAVLTVAGETEQGGRAYWERERARLTEEFGGRVRLLDWIDQRKVYDLLLGSHLYCSATLGEGCSLARLAALALGMPIISTRCGELPDLAAGMAHVRLVPPGSTDRFAGAVEQAARELPALASRIDGGAIDTVRKHLLPSRELSQWESVLREAS